MSVFLYLGSIGSGKSTLLRRHIYETPHDVRCFLIVDRDNQGTWHGPVFTSAAQFRKSPTLPKWVVFRGVRAADVAQLALDLGDCVYVDEEVHRAIAERPWKTWERGNPSVGHPLFSILHEGRHHDDAFGVSRTVSALIATHRPAQLPADLPALCDGVYLGHLPGFLDAERCYREGWTPGASGPAAARVFLSSKRVAEFTYIRQSAEAASLNP